MEIERKIAIGIVMIVPTFVFSAILWALVPSWFGVLGVVVGMAIVYHLIITGRFPMLFQRT